jgi:hypothetical protein
MERKEIRWEGADWIHLAQDKDQCRGAAKTVMNLQVPQKSGNFLTS